MRRTNTRSDYDLPPFYVAAPRGDYYTSAAALERYYLLRFVVSQHYHRSHINLTRTNIQDQTVYTDRDVS